MLNYVYNGGIVTYQERFHGTVFEDDVDVWAIVSEEVDEADDVRVDQVFVEHDLALHLVLRGAAAREDLSVDDLVSVALVVHQLGHFVNLGEPTLAYQSASSVCNL